MVKKSSWSIFSLCLYECDKTVFQHPPMVRGGSESPMCKSEASLKFQPSSLKQVLSDFGEKEASDKSSHTTIWIPRFHTEISINSEPMIP